MGESEFLGQRKNEKVIGIFRKHPLVVRRGYFVLVGALAVGMVPMLIWQAQWTVWFFVILLVFGIICLAYEYVLWYYTMFVLTNERLRVIQQKGFFRRRTTDLELMTVASISVDTPNLFGVIFRYGTLHLQSNVGDMTIFFMNNPEKVCAEIQNTIAELHGDKGGKSMGPKAGTEKIEKTEDDEPRGEIIFDDEERMIV